MKADSVPKRSEKATPQMRYEQRMSQKVVARPKNVTAAANAVAAYALVRWSEHRPMRMFFRAILGGMAARMAVMLLAVLAGVRWLHLPPLPLVISLLGYFVLFLVMELAILQRRPTLAGGSAR